MGTVTPTGLRFFHLAFAGQLLLIISLLSANVQSVNSVSNIETSPREWGNDTTGNGTLEDFFSSNEEFEGGEFLRHYAAGGRWLLQTGTKTSLRALQPAPPCRTSQYSNCIVQSKTGNGRPCTYYNRCKRA